MKRALAIVSLLFALAALPVFAQFRTATATIPFDFSVKGKVLPAGEYVVSQLIPGSWAVRTGEGTPKILFNVMVEDYPRNAQPRLVFHRYGKDLFLAQIWTESIGVSLPQSRQEAAIRASMGRPVMVALLVKR